MKLIANEISRLTVLFHAARREGQTYLPRVVGELAERYEFANAPSSFDDLATDRIVFNQGQFEGSAVDSLEVYRDGIVIASRSDTDLIDRFFADLSEWMAAEVGLTMIKTRTIDRMYESNLIVETDKNILNPLETVADIARSVENELKIISGLEVSYQPFGWSLSADPTQNPALKPIAFRIERRLGSEFEFQQFLTSAPLKTVQHMSVLERLEKLV